MIVCLSGKRGGGKTELTDSDECSFLIETAMEKNSSKCEAFFFFSLSCYYLVLHLVFLLSGSELRVTHQNFHISKMFYVSIPLKTLDIGHDITLIASCCCWRGGSVKKEDK